MELNKETYEIWMIDYFDGNLNSEEVSELRLFLLTHPELECSLEDNLESFILVEIFPSIEIAALKMICILDFSMYNFSSNHYCFDC